MPRKQKISLARALKMSPSWPKARFIRSPKRSRSKSWNPPRRMRSSSTRWNFGMAQNRSSLRRFWSAACSLKQVLQRKALCLEMKELGAATLAIANKFTPAVRSSADLAIELSLGVPELARLVVYLVWGQLLGCYFGLQKGLDPVSPRNLSRVVTLAG